MGTSSSKKTGDANQANSKLKPQASCHYFNKHQLQLMRRHLPDFTGYKAPTERDVAIVSEHWGQLNMVHGQPVDQKTGVAPVMQLFDVFYRFIFELAPDAQPLYHHSSGFKGRALTNIITGIREVLQTPNAMQTAAAIAHRHVLYGVKCEHFNPFGVALMKTLETLAPTLWTPRISDSWHRVYAQVAVLVIDSLEAETTSSKSGKTRVTSEISATAGAVLMRGHMFRSEETYTTHTQFAASKTGEHVPSKANSSQDNEQYDAAREANRSKKACSNQLKTADHVSNTSSHMPSDKSSQKLSELTEISTATSLSTTSSTSNTKSRPRQATKAVPSGNIQTFHAAADNDDSDVLLKI